MCVCLGGSCHVLVFVFQEGASFRGGKGVFNSKKREKENNRTHPKRKGRNYPPTNPPTHQPLSPLTHLGKVLPKARDLVPLHPQRRLHALALEYID